jgi:hypothetical protein
MSPEDLAHMKRIILDGCPAELTFKDPLSNKMEMISRGDSKSFNKNPEIVKKTMNKEDRYSHVVPLDILICLLPPYLRHAMQTMVIKEGRNPCLCYDPSTTKKPTDIVMNQITLVAQEAPITFGRWKIQLYINIYNTRISCLTWEMPITHIISQMPTATAFGDSCLEGAGGYSISLGYWWHLSFPEEVIQQTLMHKKDNKDGQLILSNVLEFVTVIINYCASLHVFMTRSITNDPHPILLNVTNNASALSWTNYTCRKSKLGRLLAWFFCSLLINSPLGINSQWISADDNKIAKDISHIKKTSSNTLHSSNYSSLHQMYPELTHCSFFQIQPELIWLI